MKVRFFVRKNDVEVQFETLTEAKQHASRLAKEGGLVTINKRAWNDERRICLNVTYRMNQFGELEGPF